MKADAEQENLWRQHIENWRKSSQSQADYCGLNNLSASNFSKWKSKLYPKLKGKTKRYQPKSQYSKNTKLSDQEFGTLIHSFFAGDPLRETTQKTGISTKTISKTYEELQAATVEGALQYPHLFCGAGTLLLLCPPPDVEERMLKYQDDFPHRTYRYRDESTEAGRLRNNIEFVYRLLVNYTSYAWSMAETLVFREIGLELYYHFILAPEQNIEPESWSSELYLQLAKDVNLLIALHGNMNHWAMQRGMNSFFAEDFWARVFEGRTPHSYDEKWCSQMAHDLKWTLRHKILGGTAKQRNTYWDEFAPTVEEIDSVKRNLKTHIHQSQTFGIDDLAK